MHIIIPHSSQQTFHMFYLVSYSFYFKFLILFCIKTAVGLQNSLNLTLCSACHPMISVRTLYLHRHSVCYFQLYFFLETYAVLIWFAMNLSLHPSLVWSPNSYLSDNPYIYVFQRSNQIDTLMTDSNFNYISKNCINKAIILSCWRLLSLKEKRVKETSVQVQPQKNIECI